MGLSQVSYGGEMVSGNLYHTLYSKLTSDRTWQYFSSKLFSHPQAFSYVHTTAFEKARKNSALYLNIFLSKWLSDTLATGVVMQRRHQRVFNRCPRCNHWGEDRLHIVVCWDVRAQTVWQHQMDLLTITLTNEYTAPEIQHFILQGLQNFQKHPRRPVVEDTNWKAETGHIGWLNTLSGFFSKSIIRQQDQYYNQLGMARTGTVWASKIIRQFWQLIYQMWLNRNAILHKKGVIEDISGSALLDIEIEREYDMGCQIYQPPSINGSICPRSN
jgi:hypothetical protein